MNIELRAKLEFTRGGGGGGESHTTVYLRVINISYF